MLVFDSGCKWSQTVARRLGRRMCSIRDLVKVSGGMNVKEQTDRCLNEKRRRGYLENQREEITLIEGILSNVPKRPCLLFRIYNHLHPRLLLLYQNSLHKMGREGVDIGSQLKSVFQHGQVGRFLSFQSYHNTFCWKQSTWKSKSKVELKIIKTYSCLPWNSRADLRRKILSRHCLVSASVLSHVIHS